MKIYLIAITLFILSAGIPVVAQETGSVKSASDAAQTFEKEVQNLKDKIATKVAELRKKNLKAVAGIVIESMKNDIKIKTTTEVDYEVKVDQDLTELFVVSGNKKKDLKQSDLKKGSYVIITGPVADTTINANFIYQDEQYLVKSGKVTEVNADENYSKVLTSDKDDFTLDIETSTKLQILDSKTMEVETARFSKMKEGDTVHFVVKRTGEETQKNRFSADKILIIPQEYFIK